MLLFNSNTVGLTSFTADNDIPGLTGIEIQIVDDSAAGNFILGGTESVELSSAGITRSGSDVFNTTINTDLTLGADTAITNNVGQLDLNGTLDNGGNLLTTITASQSPVVLNGIISGGGGLTVSGFSTLLSANNTYGGVTTVSSGLLGVQFNGALGDTGQPTVVESGASLAVRSDYTDAEPLILGGTLIASANSTSSFAGDISLTATSGIGTQLEATDALALTGNISGPFGINVMGVGTTTLSGTNSYSGPASVNSGTLVINGSTSASSVVTVAGGATLAGIGNVAGPVNVESGGTVSPGLSPGTIMTGDLDLMDGSIYDIEIEAPGNIAGTDFDEIEVTGSVTIGNINFNLTGTEVPSLGDEFVVIDNDGAGDPVILTGAPTEGSIIGQLNGQNLRINYHAGDGNDVALFSGVDSAAELAVWSGGSVYIDTNGNFTFDPNNADASNRDVVHTLGFATDHIFAGNFANAAGVADGFDKLAAYGRIGVGSTAQFRWLIDFTNDGVPDPPSPVIDTANIVGIPVAGNFDGSPANGDEVGLFTGNAWLFDATRDFNLGNETVVTSNMRGLPFVGDFDDDGAEDLGTYNAVNNTFMLSLSTGGGGIANPSITTTFRIGNGFPFIGVRDRPVAGDVDGDGIDDIGLWVPDRSGVLPSEAAEWYFLVSGGAAVTDRIRDESGSPVVDFRPPPFGKDLFARFGDEYAIPIVGNFAPLPPTTTLTTTTTSEPTIPTTPVPNPTLSTDASPLVVAGFGTLTVQEDAAIPEFDLNRVFSDDGELVFSVIENTNPDLAIASILNGRLRFQAFANASGMTRLTIEARDSTGNTVQDSLELHVIAVDETVVSVCEPIVPVEEPVVPVADPIVPVVATVVPASEPTLPVDEPPVPIVEVNQPPVALSTTNLSALDNSAPITIDLTAKFVDSDDSLLSYQIVSNSNPNLVAAVVTGNQLMLNVSDGNAGISIINVRAVDGAGGEATHSVIVRVTSSKSDPDRQRFDPRDSCSTRRACPTARSGHAIQ